MFSGGFLRTTGWGPTSMNSEIHADRKGSLIVIVPTEELEQLRDPIFPGHAGFGLLVPRPRRSLFRHLRRMVCLRPLSDVFAHPLGDFAFNAGIEDGPEEILASLPSMLTTIFLRPHKRLEEKSIRDILLPKPVEPLPIVAGRKAVRRYRYVRVNDKFFMTYDTVKDGRDVHIFIGPEKRDVATYGAAYKDSEPVAYVLILNCDDPDQIVDYVKTAYKYDDVKLKAQSRSSFFDALKEVIQPTPE